jgi:hypothetical protein
MNLFDHARDILPETAEFFDTGELCEGTLVRDTTVDGIRCAAGSDIVLFRTGRVRYARMLDILERDGLVFERGPIYLFPDGRVNNGTLSADAAVGGIQLPRGTRLTLEDDGSLVEYSESLRADQVVGELPCSARFNVWFYPGRRLSNCVLATGVTYRQARHEQWTELNLDEHGVVFESRLLNLEPGVQYMLRAFGAVAVSYASW